VRKFIPGSLSIYNSPCPVNFAPPRVFWSATIHLDLDSWTEHIVVSFKNDQQMRQVASGFY
jgi:hypothetical protein